jgi:hypothetical protein
MQDLLRLPGTLLHRGELARAIVRPGWKGKAYPFKYLAKTVRGEVKKGAFNESNGYSVLGNGGPRLPEKANPDPLESWIPKSLRKQAMAWPYVEDIASKFKKTYGDNCMDPWDSFSGTSNLDLYNTLRSDPPPEIPWEFIMRYLPERDGETLRKVIKTQRGEITKAVSHTDYVSLRRALVDLPDRRELHDLQEYERATEKKTLAAATKKLEAEGDYLKSSLPIVGPSDPRTCNYFEGDPGSWIWSWDKTHLRSFRRAACEKDAFSSRDSRRDTPAEHADEDPSEKFFFDS